MTRDPQAVPCTFVHHPDQLGDLGAALSSATHVAIDTEVPIADPRRHLLRVMSIAVRDDAGVERAFVVDARDLDPALLAPLLDGVTAAAWNANFDARVIDEAVWRAADTTPGLRWWDAQLADALIHQGRSGFNWFHGLAWATEHYLGIVAEGKGTIQLSYTAFDDLTADQIAYAAADAVETLWVADAIRAKIDEAGLERICQIEMEARPLLDRMERSGLPFDRSGWEGELRLLEAKQRDAISTLATMTGGGQGSLFDEAVEPSWNPGSDRQVKTALNRWAEPQVRAWTGLRFGEPRLLNEFDSVRAGVLREIGGELCDTLLDYRGLTKILTTYGESILEHIDDDGRIRPQYLQVVGTNTGRLASRNPNAQNLTPLMKPFVRPSADRVFVHADLSQAELRYLAQVADDEPLRAAFARGEDVHIATAASMFGFDATELASSDPKRLKHLRQIAKALNFGIAYGSGANALARSLTAEGTETSLEEAKTLLATYRRTYPGTTEWANARIAEIEAVKNEASAIDWPLTLKLARGFQAMNDVRRTFRRVENRWPNAAEIAELHPNRDQWDTADLVAEIEWLLGYSAPVALVANGEPFVFASRTTSGRRQQFNLHLDRLFLAVVTEALTDRTADFARVRNLFAAEHSLDLHAPDAFEERQLRRRFVEAISHELGADVAHARLARAARERVSAMVNAWRNAPIQGGVADMMLLAFGDLDQRLRDYPSSRPVQTVHDSVVVECDRSEANDVAKAVTASLEWASVVLCPDVRPKADVDIRATLAEADVIEID